MIFSFSSGFLCLGEPGAAILSLISGFIWMGEPGFVIICLGDPGSLEESRILCLGELGGLSGKGLGALHSLTISLASGFTWLAELG